MRVRPGATRIAGSVATRPFTSTLPVRINSYACDREAYPSFDNARTRATFPAPVVPFAPFALIAPFAPKLGFDDFEAGGRLRRCEGGREAHNAAVGVPDDVELAIGVHAERADSPEGRRASEL